MSGLQPIADIRNATTVHADGEVLAVCAQLAQEQAEWQRLWNAAGRPRNASRYDEERRGETLTPEMAALRDYTRRVWPATDDPYTTQGEVRTDTAHQLADLPALTLEGAKAKAVAVLALHDVAMLSEVRGDQWELTLSLLRDVAGADRRPVGEQA